MEDGLRKTESRGWRYPGGGTIARAVLLFRAALEQSLNQLYDTESKLRFLMGLAATDGRLIRPIDDPTTARVEFDWRAINIESICRSPEIRQVKWEVQRREMELIAARNNLLPQLDVGGVYKWIGVGDNLISADRNGLDFPSRRLDGLGRTHRGEVPGVRPGCQLPDARRLSPRIGRGAQCSAGYCPELEPGWKTRS